MSQIDLSRSDQDLVQLRQIVEQCCREHIGLKRIRKRRLTGNRCLCYDTLS